MTADVVETAADRVLQVYLPLFRAKDIEIPTLGSVIPIPKFRADDLLDLCRSAKSILKAQPPVIEVKPPVHILGDIHGDLHDLIRIFAKIPEISQTRVLLLGDYIDRGGYSTEVVTVLFALLVQYPDNVFLLRGNHEFKDVLSTNVLQTELDQLYGQTPLFEEMHDVFSFMPIAAVVGGAYFCVHGGISPRLKSVDDIRKIEYPVTTYRDNELVGDLLWSDPCAKITMFMDSTRGIGVLYGQAAVQQFLDAHGFKMMIRAHQCVINGTSLFKDCVVTVFSSSFYNEEENKGAFICITEDLEIQQETLAPLRPVRRAQAIFVPAKIRQKRKEMNMMSKSLLSISSQCRPSNFRKPLLARPRPKVQMQASALVQGVVASGSDQSIVKHQRVVIDTVPMVSAPKKVTRSMYNARGQWQA